MERYKLEPPKTDNIENWKAAVDNAKAQLQHQRHRHINAELLNKYGEVAWKSHSYQVTGLIKMLEHSLFTLQNQAQNINKERKISQVMFYIDRFPCFKCF